MTTHEWDARAYQRLSDPQFNWGLRVLDRLALAGDETVVDAGCGSGRLTRVLAERLPRGHVVAVDRSSNMVVEARAQLAALGERVSFACADLTTFVASPPASAVFSTATFHWIADHDRLFRSVAASLVPSGKLVAQCGGRGNLARFHAHAEHVCREARFAARFAAFAPSWHFQGPEVTAERLAASGFVDVACELERAPTPFADEETYRGFLRTVVLRQHLACLPDDALREAFLDEVVARVRADGDGLALDYVRLNIRATRATSAG